MSTDRFTAFDAAVSEALDAVAKDDVDRVRKIAEAPGHTLQKRRDEKMSKPEATAHAQWPLSCIRETVAMQQQPILQASRGCTAAASLSPCAGRA